MWESSVGTQSGKKIKLEKFLYQPNKRTILICVCGRYQNCRQNRKHEFDWEYPDERRWSEEPTSFLNHVYLGCTQTECTTSNDIVTSYRDMFESRVSAGAKGKLPTRASRKPDAEIISSWSYDMEGHAKKCVEIYCELSNKTTQQ